MSYNPFNMVMLIRYDESTHPSSDCSWIPTIELHPLRVKVLLLQPSDSTNITGPPHLYVTTSIADTVKHLCSKAAATPTQRDHVHAKGSYSYL